MNAKGGVDNFFGDGVLGHYGCCYVSPSRKDAKKS
jgi:hypothetical protein